MGEGRPRRPFCAHDGGIRYVIATDMPAIGADVLPP